jgi:hypothetical protein
MQKYVVPWSIAVHGLSFAKNMTVDSVKEILIASVIIDAEQLMPIYPNRDCATEAKKYSVALGDLAKKVKNAAGTCTNFCCVNFCAYHWSDPTCPCRTRPGQAQCGYVECPD